MAEQPHQEEHGAEDSAVAEEPADPKTVAGHDAIRLMLGEVFKITAPRDFQIGAIYNLAFLLVVQDGRWQKPSRSLTLTLTSIDMMLATKTRQRDRRCAALFLFLFRSAETPSSYLTHLLGLSTTPCSS